MNPTFRHPARPRLSIGLVASIAPPGPWLRAFLLVSGSLLMLSGTALPASESPEAASPSEPVKRRVIKAPDWMGASDTGIEGCHVFSGEYSVWIYATAAQCGVPREQADRVVIIRQPLPGVAPIRANSELPAGSYAVWVYGAGDSEHLALRLCAKTCLIGELPAAPDWAFLGWITIRDNQSLLLKSWQQPDGHRLHIQEMVLSTSETKPDWVP